MIGKVKNGDTVYVIRSNRFVTEASVLRRDGEFVLIRMKGMEGAIRLRFDRLFGTEEEAVNQLPPSARKNGKNNKNSHSAY